MSVRVVIMHVPEREARAVEARIELDGCFEITRFRGRRRRDKPLDVVFEHGQSGLRGRRGRSGRPGDAPAYARENREQIFERARLDELVRHLSCVEADVLRAHRYHAAGQPHRTDDDVCGADNLSEPYHGGMTEARDGWNLQPLESIETLFPGVCVLAGCIQIVSK